MRAPKNHTGIRFVLQSSQVKLLEAGLYLSSCSSFYMTVKLMNDGKFPRLPNAYLFLVVCVRARVCVRVCVCVCVSYSQYPVHLEFQLAAISLTYSIMFGKPDFLGWPFPKLQMKTDLQRMYGVPTEHACAALSVLGKLCGHRELHLRGFKKFKQ